MRKRITILLLRCYLLDLLFLYVPGVIFFLFTNRNLDLQIMIFGLRFWGLTSQVFYMYGWLFLFIIVAIDFSILAFLKEPYFSRKRVISFPILLILYFAMAAVIGILYRGNKFFFETFLNVFLESLVLSWYIILASPISYLIVLSHYRIHEKMREVLKKGN